MLKVNRKSKECKVSASMKTSISSILILGIILMQLAGVGLITAIAATTFTTSNGSVIFEAEDTTYEEATIWNGYDGYEESSSSSTMGGAYLRAHSYSASSSTPSEALMEFNVTADVSGYYNLWVRAKAASDEDAVWLYFNNEGYFAYYLDNSDTYTWQTVVSGVYLAAGSSYNFKFHPKEANHYVDAFIFTNKATYVPTGIVTSTSSIVNTLLTSGYSNMSILPPNEHPRLMFRQSNVAGLISNMSASQNSSAKTYFDGLIATSFTGTLTPTPGVDNYDLSITAKIEANAFYYALYGDTTKGNKAISELINYLNTITFDTDGDEITRQMGETIFKASEVYDWCYDLLTTAQKNTIIEHCEQIATLMEIGYPVTAQGNVTGHGSEYQLLRDLLSFSVAVYDERPDIYNAIAGRVFNEYVAPRNFYYQSHSTYQGSQYYGIRYHAELYAYYIIYQMTCGEVELFSNDFKAVPYDMLYNHRPDGRMFVRGDDGSLDWKNYNGYSFKAMMMAGNMFADPYIKGDYRKMRSSEDFNNSNYKDYTSFNSVFWLIMNNPNVDFTTNRSAMPQSKYFDSPNGAINLRTGWTYNTSAPASNSVVAAYMRIGEQFSGNHDHLDAGNFQLYYKGILASESGYYDEYDSRESVFYDKRTISANTLTIYDPSESFTTWSGRATSVDTNIFPNGVNDGGQLFPGPEANDFTAWTNGYYDHGIILDHELGANNAYSYLKGDITEAYSSNKVSNVVRNMVFVPLDDEDYPAIMVVFDQVTSTNASYIKKFLLHTQVEPTISGDTTTVLNTLSLTSTMSANNGKLTMKTLLPINANITKIGEDGYQFWVGDQDDANYSTTKGINYTLLDTVTNLHEVGWGRVEISPSTAATSDEFLNVLMVSDADNTATAPATTLIEGTNLTGAKVSDHVLMFSNQTSTDKDRVQSSASFVVSGSGAMSFTVMGLKEGQWTVQNGSTTVATPIAGEDGGTITFEGCCRNIYPDL